MFPLSPFYIQISSSNMYVYERILYNTNSTEEQKNVWPKAITFNVFCFLSIYILYDYSIRLLFVHFSSPSFFLPCHFFRILCFFFFFARQSEHVNFLRYPSPKQKKIVRIHRKKRRTFCYLLCVRICITFQHCTSFLNIPRFEHGFRYVTETPFQVSQNVFEFLIIA